jgi:hypothetical protein
MPARPRAAWRSHRRKYLLFLAALIAAPTVAFVAARRSSGTASRPPTLAQLAAKNYRTLSAAESTRLLRYAEGEYRCVVSEDAAIAAPVASRTRITMRARNRSADQLVRLMTACDSRVGPPPRGASLQARDEQILVYVPKRCLLNPKELRQGAS